MINNWKVLRPGLETKSANPVFFNFAPMAQAGYKIRNPEGIYFLSCAVVQWIDVFTRLLFADLVVESMNFCVEKSWFGLGAVALPLFFGLWLYE